MYIHHSALRSWWWYSLNTLCECISKCKGPSQLNDSQQPRADFYSIILETLVNLIGRSSSCFVGSYLLKTYEVYWLCHTIIMNEHTAITHNSMAVYCIKVALDLGTDRVKWRFLVIHLSANEIPPGYTEKTLRLSFVHSVMKVSFQFTCMAKLQFLPLRATTLYHLKSKATARATLEGDTRRCFQFNQVIRFRNMTLAFGNRN